MTKTKYTAVLYNSIPFVLKKREEYIFKLLDTKTFFSEDMQDNGDLREVRDTGVRRDS